MYASTKRDIVGRSRDRVPRRVALGVAHRLAAPVDVVARAEARPAPRRRIAWTASSAWARPQSVRRRSAIRAGDDRVQPVGPIERERRHSPPRPHRGPCQAWLGTLESAAWRAPPSRARARPAWLRCYRCWSTEPRGAGALRGHPQDRPRDRRARRGGRRAPGGGRPVPGLHARPAAPAGSTNGRVEPIEDRWERMIAGTPWVASCTVDGRRRRRRDLLRPRGGRRAQLRRVRRARHARVLHPRALPQARGRGRRSSSTCWSSSTRARPRRPPRCWRRPRAAA